MAGVSSVDYAVYLNYLRSKQQQPAAAPPVSQQNFAQGGIVELDPYKRAFLDAIAARESPGYNVLYGGKTFSDYSDHPGQYIPIQSGPNQGKKSSAAGRYQFLESTWDEYSNKLGLKDFSPRSQDIGAWALAEDTYGGNLADTVRSGDPSQIINAASQLRGKWTSLPGGIEQGQGGKEFYSHYQNALNKYLNSAAPDNMTAAPQFDYPEVEGEPYSPDTYSPEPYSIDLGVEDTGTSSVGDPSQGIASLVKLMTPETPKPPPAPPPPPMRRGVPHDPNAEAARTSHSSVVYDPDKRRFVVASAR